MRKFSYVSHTADMAFIAYGSTLNMAIRNSALALISTMLDVKAIEKSKGSIAIHPIIESATNAEELVWFTLQDILSAIDSKKISAFKLEILKMSQTNKGFSLRGRLLYKKQPNDYSLLSVKAVTPHDLTVKKEQGIYRVHVVVDV